MRLSIHQIEYFIPDSFVKISDNYHEFGLSNKEMRVYNKFYGINSIPVSSFSMQEMLLKVTSPIMLNVDKEKVLYVIMVRTAPVVAPFNISLVKGVAEKLGIINAMYFTIGMNKCVSILRAFEVAEKLLRYGDKDKYALIISGETIFTEENRVLPNITIGGDAATAILVGLGNKHVLPNTLLALNMQIYGKYSKGSWMAMDEVAEFGQIFNKSMSKVIQGVLLKANINYDQVKLILPHNVNVACWRGFCKFEGIPFSKVFLDNISQTAHCFNSDLLINLATAIKTKRLRSGDYYVMATVGVGAMFGAAIFQY